jgi:glycosyltransferase involved in cell wall biosynthesis
MYNYHPMMTFAPTIARRQVTGVCFVTRYESPFAGATPGFTLGARLVRKLVVTLFRKPDVVYESGTLLRDSDHLIALCEEHRTVLADKWPGAREKIVIIPPPPSVVVLPGADGSVRRRGRAKLGVSNDEFLVAFFGYVYPKKGIEDLIKAFKVVQSERTNARLVFIGGTIDIDAEVSKRYWEAMQSLCKDAGVADRTIWTGAFAAGGEDASLYLQAADICVLPLLKGVQLNNSSFSAMAAHGKPIVTTRGLMTDEAFIDGENVLLCEPQDTGALAKRILVLMDSEELRNHLSAGVTKLAQDCLSWDVAVERTLSLLTAR